MNNEKISIKINNEQILETNLEAKLFYCAITDIPFLPDSLIDINTDFILLRIIPSIISAANIGINSLFYRDVYDKLYKIFENHKPTTLEIIRFKKRELESFNNTKSITQHFQNKLVNNLAKLIE